MTEVSKEIQYVGPDGRLTYEGMALLRSFGAAPAPAWGDITGTLSDQTDLNTALNGKQATLVSGTNIKTVNGNSLLGSGNVAITVSTSDVLTATAGATAGAVGTYVTAVSSPAANINFGATAAGSTLFPSSNLAASATALSGTWRCMGHLTTAGGITLFLRIS